MSTLKFTEEHAWIRLEDDEVAVAGISDCAQRSLGDMVYVELPELGKMLGRGDEAVVLEAVKTTSSMKMPLTGVVLSTNAEVQESPELINNDPEGDGWLLTFQITHPEELAHLMDEAAYRDFVAELDAV